MRARLLLAITLLAAAPARAQDVPRPAVLEVRPFVGVFVPAGALRDDFRAATALGAQGAVEVRRRLHLVGTVGWTAGRNRYGLTSDRTDIWTYDVGFEANLVRAIGTRWKVRPFAGAGAGARTWSHRAAGADSRTCATGHVASGSELQRGSIALRLEGRGYASCYTSPLTGREHTRGDVVGAFAIAWHRRWTP